MKHPLSIYNSLSRSKELFKPINEPHVGLYVCGPTVYGDAHLGHARPAITFDILFRYLKYLGYKVRYVRNITDVGHLEDVEGGEDKISKKARLEKLEPMEVVQHFSDNYHKDMDALNTLKPSIEPRASGHIIEQIEFIKEIIDEGYAYITNGSVYFDVPKYNENHNYGKLSGRVIDELLSNTRELEGQSEKKSPLDFALWKKAQPEHIMKWPSEWSVGFPGWHLECSAMGSKYLGDQFDIHGGGMDLKFPHHECEIAQSIAAKKKDPVVYWMHNNMITIDGQKMGKSLNNFITLQDFFNGSHSSLDKPYSPMCIKFFILQAHYRSTLDFSNQSLQAAEKGLNKLLKAISLLETIKASSISSIDINEFENKCFAALNDDLNTPILISHLFEAVKNINLLSENKASLKEIDLEKFKVLLNDLIFNILGLKDEKSNNEENFLVDDLMNIIIKLRREAREKKDWSTADIIRDELNKLKISLKDNKNETSWEQSL